MKKYYLQKKTRMDSSGNEHINFNLTVPQKVVQIMGLDQPDREDRAFEVDFDVIEETITFKKITR